MATTVNIHEAKTQLSKLIALVEGGETVVIARAGVPVADLVVHEHVLLGKRKLSGVWKDRIDMSGFDEADAEIAREFGLD